MGRQLFFAATAACATYLVRWDSLAAELRSTCHSAKIHDVVFPVRCPLPMARRLAGTHMVDASRIRFAARFPRFGLPATRYAHDMTRRLAGTLGRREGGSERARNEGGSVCVCVRVLRHVSGLIPACRPRLLRLVRPGNRPITPLACGLLVPWLHGP